jgi:hypothetical protein
VAAAAQVENDDAVPGRAETLAEGVVDPLVRAEPRDAEDQGALGGSEGAGGEAAGAEVEIEDTGGRGDQGVEEGHPRSRSGLAFLCADLRRSLNPVMDV